MSLLPAQLGAPAATRSPCLTRPRAPRLPPPPRQAVLRNSDGSAIWEAGDNKVIDLVNAAALELAHTFAG